MHNLLASSSGVSFDPNDITIELQTGIATGGEDESIATLDRRRELSHEPDASTTVVITTSLSTDPRQTSSITTAVAAQTVQSISSALHVEILAITEPVTVEVIVDRSPPVPPPPFVPLVHLIADLDNLGQEPSSMPNTIAVLSAAVGLFILSGIGLLAMRKWHPQAVAPDKFPVAHSRVGADSSPATSPRLSAWPDTTSAHMGPDTGGGLDLEKSQVQPQLPRHLLPRPGPLTSVAAGPLASLAMEADKEISVGDFDADVDAEADGQGVPLQMPPRKAGLRVGPRVPSEVHAHQVGSATDLRRDSTITQALQIQSLPRIGSGGSKVAPHSPLSASTVHDANDVQPALLVGFGLTPRSSSTRKGECQLVSSERSKSVSTNYEKEAQVEAITSAIRLQTRWRGRASVKHTRHLIRMQVAAVKVQSAWRGHCIRDMLAKENASTTLSKAWRRSQSGQRSGECSPVL